VVPGDHHEMLAMLEKLQTTFKKKSFFEQQYKKGELVRKIKKDGSQGPALKDYYA
jgi:hypothetical protein